MKNGIKKSWQWCFKLCLVVLLSVPVTIGVNATATGPLTYQAPSVTKTWQSNGSVSFAWGAVSEATGYEYWYVRRQNQYTSPVMSTGNTDITVSGLSSGTYKFYFRSVFEDGVSDYVIIDDLIIM